MRSIYSREFYHTHWLRIDNNQDEIKQWKNLKDFWNKYDCSMTVYYYDYNPLTEKVIKLDCNQSYEKLDLDVNSMLSGSLKRVKAKPTNITVYNKGIEHFFVQKLGIEVLKTLRKPNLTNDILKSDLIEVDFLNEFKFMKNNTKFNELMKDKGWKIVKIPSDRGYHYQLYFGEGKQVYNRYEYAFSKFNYKSRFKDRLERFINNVLLQQKLNLNNYIGRKINMFESEHQFSLDKKIKTDIKCIGLVLGINNNCFDIYDFKKPLGEQFYSLNIDDFEEKMNQGIYKPNYNLLAAHEKLELKKYEYNKLREFNKLCGDWDYRNEDMLNPHLAILTVKNDNLLITFKKYSDKIDDYIFSNKHEIQSKDLLRDFRLLDLVKKEDVIDYMKTLEGQVDFKNMLKEINANELEQINIIENNKMLDEIEIC